MINQKKLSLTLVELLTVMCIILFITGLFAVYAKMALKTVRESALINELINLRMSIEHYRVVKGGLPDDLFTLVNDGHNKFLKPFRVDKQGFMLDPFMHRYLYDKRDGRVRSQTKRYENW